MQCNASPNGIPDPIALGKMVHDDPYPGDHGIRFESAFAEKTADPASKPTPVTV
jgi:hypothetical protein